MQYVRGISCGQHVSRSKSPGIQGFGEVVSVVPVIPVGMHLSRRGSDVRIDLGGPVDIVRLLFCTNRFSYVRCTVSDL